MLATLVREPFHNSGWVYEEKYDGYRILAYKEGSRVKLLSRNAKDRTGTFGEIAQAVGHSPRVPCCWMAKWWRLTAGACRASSYYKICKRRPGSLFLTACIAMARICGGNLWPIGAQLWKRPFNPAIARFSLPPG